MGSGMGLGDLHRYRLCLALQNVVVGKIADLRPVLASVVSLLILLVGLQAVFSLQIREYPELSNTTITITTTYPGASADVIKGFVYNELEGKGLFGLGGDLFPKPALPHPPADRLRRRAAGSGRAQRPPGGLGG